MDARDLFLKNKEVVRKRTREILALLRPEHKDFRPVPGALSVGEMLRHLWVSEAGVLRVALHADFSYYETRIPQGLFAVLGTPRTLEEEIADMERVHRESLQQVSAFPAEEMETERVLETFGYRRKVYVILLGIIEHEIHHRAQLMTYLRILGTPAPEPIARPKSGAA
ncbi:MAG TPA: DinB family protein [Candidatus Nitrosotenuis sp.]|nr:DinB family protein [Candidatus Nitrosotenuis sp.]